MDRYILVNMEKIKIEQHGFVGDLLGLGMALHLGFLHLTFWKGVLGIVLWPYYLGTWLSSLPH